MNDEFKRMSAILQEAAKNLHECFGGMSNQLARQSEQLRMYNSACKQDQASGDDIDALLSRAVRSLQFEDILQQMITHSRRRVEEIERLFVILTAHINALNRNEAGNPGEILDMLRDCITDIDVVKCALRLENPVKYPSLNQGEIDLF